MNVVSLFALTDKQFSEATERIAQLEQLVDRLTLALEIQKKHRRYWIESILTATPR